MYIFYNNNPAGLRIGDCVVRAISTALNQPWERTYVGLCIEGFTFQDMPNANAVWASYLRSIASLSAVTIVSQIVRISPEMFDLFAPRISDILRLHQRASKHGSSISEPFAFTQKFKSVFYHRLTSLCYQ